MKSSSDYDGGKTRLSEAASAQRRVMHFVLIGVCLGMIISERLYVSHSKQVKGDAGSSGGFSGATKRSLNLIGGALRRQGSVHGEKLAQGEGDGYTGPPRSDLEAVLREVAINHEVLAAVSNKNYLFGQPAMLQTFTDGFKRAGIKNHLILALDQETKTWCDEHGVNAMLFNLQVHKAQADTGENHAVSAMKFGILRQFVDIGYSVLLSDVDIAILQNPFDFLYRDSDVEGMTDGFDEASAYGSIEGFEDASMGWARFAQFYKHFNLNSGLFYLRANEHTQELMKRLDDRLSKEKYWDQTAFNEEIFFLSHGKYKSPQCSVRVMEIDLFMNSKRLFKDLRHRPKAQQPPKPVTVHINYHPDKHERMLAVIKYYVDGDEHALDPFPNGSEPGSK